MTYSQARIRVLVSSIKMYFISKHLYDITMDRVERRMIAFRKKLISFRAVSNFRSVAKKFGPTLNVRLTK